jgi:3-dehydroquinate synthase
VKVALVKDPGFFQWLEANASALGAASPDVVATLVRRAAELHLAHIVGAGDPFEMGSARPLDYGHWLAHRLEVASGYELRHGEAVAIGMLLDARYAELSGFLSADERARIASLLSWLGLPRVHAALAERSGGRPSVLRGLEEFREHLGGQLTITLLAAIGRGFEVNAIDEQRMEECIEWLLEDRA